MRINFNQNLKTLLGEDLKEQGKTVSLKDICSSALANKTEGNSLDKQKAYKLAVDIAKSTGDVEITAEDVALIKKELGGFPAIYCGQACEMLEGN